MRGWLIALEGVEGSGKSTQAELLIRALRAQGVPCLLSREPGGTPIGERIREILLDNQHQEMHPKTELLLYLASRNQHVQEKLLPALREGKIVVCDRFAESSLAYQGAGRGLTMRVVSRLNKFATGGLRADLVIVIDMPPDEALKRRRTVPPDRLETEQDAFHERIRAAYLYLARRAPKRIKVFDGREPAEELHRKVVRTVLGFLSQKGPRYLKTKEVTKI